MYMILIVTSIRHTPRNALCTQQKNIKEKEMYKFEMIERNWYKCRYPVPDPDVVSFEVVGYEQTENHFCQVIFVYDNDTIKTMIGRVIQNKIKGHWTIDCMNHALLVSER